MNSNEASIFEVAQEMIQEDVFEAMENRPLQTLAIAFSLGFYATRMFQEGGRHDLQKKLKSLLGAIMVEGLLNRH
jgi:hypothetical protein